ncbi:hypothetical protein ACNTMW_12075 [Planosporangium sp. 12N6]|uniref:hypothetical protein n=1 Tax=Planosporangium spinosum TaxID=3402278 RepID=UPI003CF6262A
MVAVRLAQDWTDGGGEFHAAGDMVDVDAVTLAQLEANGVVASAEPGPGKNGTNWAGETGNPQWAGETGTNPQWAGETGIQT